MEKFDLRLSINRKTYTCQAETIAKTFLADAAVEQNEDLILILYVLTNTFSITHRKIKFPLWSWKKNMSRLI